MPGSKSQPEIAMAVLFHLFLKVVADMLLTRFIDIRVDWPQIACQVFWKQCHRILDVGVMPFGIALHASAADAQAERPLNAIITRTEFLIRLKELTGSGFVGACMAFFDAENHTPLLNTVATVQAHGRRSWSSVEFLFLGSFVLPGSDAKSKMIA
ncbi:hypothetical protein FN846DRAFT_912588 [Sphaerosporella brunnea]|uniref:Uncharacterized protein n=1 Tax=Sphaerosporella brunnea TaxID=1250544 RepID=A0A5J5EHW7_9PEZI|nr:hypothetical protein FN846DRAFT_912588 [Sphaerosporella brunnea]